eukprot:8188216-Pyramimonas_sp.AAC.1
MRVHPQAPTRTLSNFGHSHVHSSRAPTRTPTSSAQPCVCTCRLPHAPPLPISFTDTFVHADNFRAMSAYFERFQAILCDFVRFCGRDPVEGGWPTEHYASTLPHVRTALGSIAGT